MIDILFEQRIIQNAGLAAEVIWQVVFEAYEENHRTEGVPFPLAFLVLPLTFHKRTAVALADRKKPGAIYKALADDREITVGLQSRMESLADRTFEALSLGFSTNLFYIDQDIGLQLMPSIRKPPVEHVTNEVKIIFKAAKRVGQSFAELTLLQIINTLEVKF